METSKQDWDWAAMRPWSKAMFRREHRLAVAVLARVANADELYAQAIADHLRLHQTEVAEHLRDLQQAGLLKPSGKKAPTSPKGGRPGIIYTRAPDTFWDCLEAAGERFRS
jgi:predicted ArsR family transcriptional regulator